LRPVKSYARMREYGSNATWFSVQFMVYYLGNKVRSFAYVQRDDSAEIPDGEYEVLEGLDEARCRWKKLDGKWHITWRHGWNKRPPRF
jgi:hypothetical protein